MFLVYLAGEIKLQTPHGGTSVLVVATPFVPPIVKEILIVPFAIAI
jgi:hypothetical protein